MCHLQSKHSALVVLYFISVDMTRRQKSRVRQTHATFRHEFIRPTINIHIIIFCFKHIRLCICGVVVTYTCKVCNSYKLSVSFLPVHSDDDICTTGARLVLLFILSSGTLSIYIYIYRIIADIRIYTLMGLL